MFAALRIRSFYHFSQDRIRLEISAFKILVDYNHVVAVVVEVEQDVFLKQTKMHLVGHVNQLRHHDFLVLLVVDADERGVVTKIKKGSVVFLFHNLAKCVCWNVEAQARIEIVIHAASFLDQIDAARDTSFTSCVELGGLFADQIVLVG